MAASIWTKDGKLMVDAQGHPLLCDSCPCEADCQATDLLILTCNANLITDDDYDVVLNGTTLTSVASIDSGGCNSPGTGAWCATDDTIRPDTIVDLTSVAACASGWSCQACLDEDPPVWTYARIDRTTLAASNELQINSTRNAGCSNWGVVTIFMLGPSGNPQMPWRVCETLICDTYQGANIGDITNLFDGFFPWP